MEFEYRVTVIIPVYNVALYLKDCLDSLVVQSIPQEDMEVLMINDGSTDGSLEICEQYAEIHENFKVLSQENQGVSAARNYGIRSAKGKYLMYLDGDDTLSEETVKNVVDFFDEHYDEVDLVTYPLTYHYEDGSAREHERYKTLNHTDIFSLTHGENTQISLSLINVCVKNCLDANLFSELLKMSEDQLYVIEILCPKGVIGFVKEADYKYLKHCGATTDLGENPYFCSKDILTYFESLLELKKVYPDMEEYIDNLIIYNLNWRIKEDKLFPYHMDKDSFEKYRYEIRRIIDNVCIERILQYPKMNDAHKYFILSMKTSDRPFVYLQRNCKNSNYEILLLNNVGKLQEVKNILIVIEQCKIENDSFYLLGFLKEYTFDFMEKPQLFAIIDNQTYIEVPLFLSQQSCFWSQMRTNTFWGFFLEKDLRSFSKLGFVVRVGGKEFCANYWMTERQGLQTKIKRNYITGNEFSIMFEKNQFLSVRRNSNKILLAEKRYNEFLYKCKRKQWLVCSFIRMISKPRIWIYEDTYNSIDNSYYQFQHDFYKNDGIKRYYICDKESLNWKDKFTPDQQRHLVQRRSKKHKMLFLQAEKILTSFIGWSDFVPFDKNTILYYWHLFHFEVVYLQHGVMHAELPYMYSKEKVYMIDKVVVSTYFERENLVNKLAYREKDIIPCGMPRLDRLAPCKREKKILFAPSWRKYLVSLDASGKRIAQTNFENSDYFQEVRTFLTDKRLSSLLEEYGYRLEIKLHPNFGVYSEPFARLCDRNVVLVKDIQLSEYAACITDFSSFMYDFMYLNIPVFIYIFDYEKFKAGLHTYRDFCWKIEEYPYYCRDMNELFRWIERIIDNPENIENNFRYFTENLFFDREPNHADRLYKYLISDKSSG